MTDQVPLILDVSPMQRLNVGPTPPTSPTVAVVYATATGELACFDGRPLNWSEAFYSRYRTRYDVDVSDHRRTAELRSTPLPARGDAFFFEATVDVGFRVSDPKEVVRRNVTDALPVIYGFLLSRLRAVTRRFDIEQSAEAEAEINRIFAGQTTLPDGIALFACSARLLPDAAARRHIRDKVEAARKFDRHVVEHVTDLQSAEHAGRLADVEQGGRIARQQREAAALGGRQLDPRQLVMLHLSKHPEDTKEAFNLLIRYEEATRAGRDHDDERDMALLKFMVEHDLIQPVDVDRLREQTVRQVRTGGDQAALPAANAWPTPAALPPAEAWSDPPVAAQVHAPASQPPTAGQVIDYELSPDGKVWQPNHGLMPVYLMIDESSKVGPYITELNVGVRSLHASLLQYANLSSAVRLSVLGYADDVATRLPMDGVSSSRTPWLSVRGGCRYVDAFEALRSRIPRDIEALKQAGMPVHRPVVHFLSAGPPDDSGAWMTPYHELVDRAGNRYAPNVVACGMGTAEASVITRIATRPEFGFIATADTDPPTAMGRYWAFLQRSVLGSAAALVNGAPELLVDPPDGFRIASDRV